MRASVILCIVLAFASLVVYVNTKVLNDDAPLSYVYEDSISMPNQDMAAEHRASGFDEDANRSQASAPKSVTVSQGVNQKKRQLFMSLLKAEVEDFQTSALESYLQQDPEFFHELAHEYLHSDNVEFVNNLQSLMQDVVSESKLTISRELTHSENINHRQRAYEWLASVSNQFPEAINALVDASYTETDPNGLMDVTAALEQAIPQGEENDYIVLEHLQQMAQNKNTSIASHAISLLGARYPDESTLDILKFHLEGNSAALRHSALDSLHNFEQADGDVVALLDSLASNDSEKDYIRRMASDLKHRFDVSMN